MEMLLLGEKYIILKHSSVGETEGILAAIYQEIIYGRLIVAREHEL